MNRSEVAETNGRINSLHGGAGECRRCPSVAYSERQRFRPFHANLPAELEELRIRLVARHSAASCSYLSRRITSIMMAREPCSFAALESSFAIRLGAVLGLPVDWCGSSYLQPLLNYPAGSMPPNSSSLIRFSSTPFTIRKV